MQSKEGPFHPEPLLPYGEITAARERHDGAIQAIVGLTFGALFLVWAAFATNSPLLIPLAGMGWLLGFRLFWRRRNPLGFAVLLENPPSALAVYNVAPAHSSLARKLEDTALSVKGIRQAYLVKCSGEGLSYQTPYLLAFSVDPGRPCTAVVTDLARRSADVRFGAVAVLPLLPSEDLLAHIRIVHAALYSGGITEAQFTLAA